MFPGTLSSHLELGTGDKPLTQFTKVQATRRNFVDFRSFGIRLSPLLLFFWPS